MKPEKWYFRVWDCRTLCLGEGYLHGRQNILLLGEGAKLGKNEGHVGSSFLF